MNPLVIQLFGFLQKIVVVVAAVKSQLVERLIQAFNLNLNLIVNLNQLLKANQLNLLLIHQPRKPIHNNHLLNHHLDHLNQRITQ